jgi:hypothetical protein
MFCTLLSLERGDGECDAIHCRADGSQLASGRYLGLASSLCELIQYELVC